MSFREGPIDEASGIDEESESSESKDDSPEQKSIEEILSNTRITDKHRAFLRCIHDYDGRAPISKIKDKTGLSQDEAHSRFQKWSSDEFNLIDVEKLSPEESGKPTGERVALLNERGEQAIKQGLLGDVFDDEEKEVRRVFGNEEVEDFEEMQDEVERLESVVTRLQKRVDGDDAVPADNSIPNDISGELEGLEEDIIRLTDKVGSLRSRIERVESDSGLDELDGVAARVSTLENRMDETDSKLESLADEFREFRENAKEHLLNAEAYMKGTRWALEEKFDEAFDVDIDIGEKISKVRKSQNE